MKELEKEFYTGLQVTSDPGVPIVYAGFILLIAGCWVTFLIPHQKIMIDVQAASNSSRIQIFGTTSRNPIGFEIMIGKMSANLQQLGK
ncbi:cytochrome c biogenesis protein ResB [Desulfobacterales bacterium HSG17]|nr:cytochrome c biogenesis protein ResB [Desulfobacterales bacterium HSG17]